MRAGAPRLAFGELHGLIWQVQTFGFHLADLEIRQHSSVHRNALAELRAAGARCAETDEVVATLRTIALLQQRLGARVCHRYVVSFTEGAGDIANVYALAEMACAPGAAESQNEPAQVALLRQRRHFLTHISRVHRDGFARAVRRGE